MSARKPPGIDARRAQDFRAEMLTRARSWLRNWSLDESPGDFGVALLDVASRFFTHVAERLDRAGEKQALGFLDWLAVRGKAAKPARMPVAFKLADAARERVTAPKGTRLQASVDGATVVFETETPVRLVPGSLDQLVGVDATGDRYFLAPPGMTSLDPLDPRPDLWMLKNFANQGTDALQLDPALGLDKGAFIEFGGNQYRVLEAKDDLVKIEPGVQNVGGQPAGTVVTRVGKFAPFGGTAHNEQQHVVYLGDKDLFNIETAAVIEVHGTNSKLGGATWEYFGKSATDDEAKWRSLPAAPDSKQRPGILTLEKPVGSVEPTDVDNVKGARWLRAWQTTVADATGILDTDALSVIINPDSLKEACPATGSAAPGAEAGAEGFANTTALAFTGPFYPLGKEPKQFDTFYLGSADAFSKEGAKVSVCFEMSDPTANAFSVLREGLFANRVLASVGGDGALHLIEVDTSNGSLRPFLNHVPLQPNVNGAAVRLDAKPKFRLPIWAVEENGLIPSNVSAPVNPLGNIFGTPFGGGLFGIGQFGFLGLPLNNPFYVATTAGTSVWVYKEFPSFTLFSKWTQFGSVAGPNNATSIDGLVRLRDDATAAGAKLFALCGGGLFSHSAALSQATDNWVPVPLTHSPAANAGGEFVLKAISPIETMDSLGRWHGSLTDGMVGLFTNRTTALVYFIGTGGDCVALDDAKPAEAATQPAAAHIGSSLYVFWQNEKPPPANPSNPPDPAVLRVAKVDPNNLGAARATDEDAPVPLPGDDSPAIIEGGLLEIGPHATQIKLLASGTRENKNWILSWGPYSGDPKEYFESKLPSGIGPLGGAPTALENFVVVPGTQSDAWVARWDASLHREFEVELRSGVVVPASLSPAIARHDWIGVLTTSTTQLDLAEVGQFADLLGTELFLSLDQPFGVGAGNAELVVFRLASNQPGFTATLVDSSTMTLDPNDPDTEDEEWLIIIDGNGFQPVQVDDIDTNRDAALKGTPNLTGTIHYWRGERIPGRVAPYMELDPNQNGNWDASLLDFTTLSFAGCTPAIQRAKAFAVTGTNRPLRVVMSTAWEVNPANPVACALDAAFGNWSRQLSENPSNPKLAWEYWNGRAWDTLSITKDDTQNFKVTGRLDFTVPVALVPTDVGGKTNYWIRARLIEGDYGREIVTVVTKPNPNVQNSTIQEVVHDTSNFHPPYVVNMRIRYSVSKALMPTYLLTRDSGSLRDQSDANRTPGAHIEAFVPLSVLMSRLTRTTPAESEVKGDADPAAGCACAEEPAATPVAPPAKTAATAAGNDLSLFLGFNAELREEPVNVLLLVDEQPHDRLAPLAVEALVNDRFDPITVKDATRALGESGVLSMSFPVVPSPRDLFGQSRTWLRLRPSRADPDTPWKPVIRGAYFNATWAAATETLTREPLGSSDGRPGLTLRVARPPLLQDSLELRVREPLDGEERKAMLAADTSADPDATSVKSDIPEMAGDWVLWRQVPDPSDYGPQDRVYSLDEALGEVRFGDGIHGMIPPIGRDAVVAFKYQRTEPPVAGSGDEVPANAVEARSPLNLVTPVESVESAVSAEHAAGGAPPESTQRVLKFGNSRLRHRERAITARDFEDLALASSPDIAQARAFKSPRALRLVVAMRGEDPLPDAPQRRELRSLLEESASPLLGGAAISIGGPRLRALRIALVLRVESLDDAGDTARAVRDRLKSFFDSASGGVEGIGWPIGAAPAEDDIAFALADAPKLEGIAKIRMLEVLRDETEDAWRPAVRSDELVRLAKDGVRIEFETLEVEA